MPGIEQAIRVEHVLNAPHQRKIGFAEKQRHQAILLHPNAVLAGDRAAHLNAELDDFIAGANGVAKLLLVALVEKNDRDADCRLRHEIHCRFGVRISC